MSVSNERMEKALAYLATTDESAAELKTDVERKSFKVKKIKAAIFTHSSGNIEERKAAAEVAPETLDAEAGYLHAHTEFGQIDNKRKTEALVIDCWRSINSARTKGIMV